MIENRLLDDILPIDPPRPAGAIAAIKDAMLLRWHVFISGYPVVLNCKTTGSLEQAIDRLEQRENFDPKSLICSGITKATRPRWCWCERSPNRVSCFVALRAPTSSDEQPQALSVQRA